MSRLLDLTGCSFGRLTVISRAENIGKHTAWKCRCQCGNIISILGFCLTNGNTRSCGCLKSDTHKVHGLWAMGKDIYICYRGMINRCYHPKQQNYERYGERGIRVCDEWLNDPIKFGDWAKENGFKKGLQIDRVNSDGPYSPDNCRFVTAKENCRNRRNTIKLGGWGCLSHICETLGISVIVEGDTTNKYKRLCRFIKKHGPLSESLEHVKA